MSAFLIFHSTVKDPKKFKIYAQAVASTLTPFDGEVVQKGKVVAVLEGEHPHQAVGILKFPNVSAALDWYNSPDYQALIANRNAAADLTVIGYDEPAA